MEKNKRKSIISLSDIFMVIIVIAVVMGLRTYVIAPAKVNGHSMDPTLETGEVLIMNKWSDIKKNDIVTFISPTDNKTIFIKRVIALEGDTVEMKKDVLYINGKEIEEPYLKEHRRSLDEGELLTENFGPVEVGKDQFFAMGDNRLNSLDSRTFGPIDKERLEGKVLWK